MPSSDNFIEISKFAEFLGRQVSRVRLDRLRKGVHEELEHVLRVQFVDAALEVVVTLGQGFDDGFVSLSVSFSRR